MRGGWIATGELDAEAADVQRHRNGTGDMIRQPRSQRGARRAGMSHAGSEPGKGLPHGERADSGAALRDTCRAATVPHDRPARPNGATERHPFGGIAPHEWDRWPPQPGRFGAGPPHDAEVHALLIATSSAGDRLGRKRSSMAAVLATASTPTGRSAPVTRQPLESAGEGAGAPEPVCWGTVRKSDDRCATAAGETRPDRAFGAPGPILAPLSASAPDPSIGRVGAQ
jgi:hypothetical protein